MRAPVSPRNRLNATLCWFGCLVGFGVAFVAAVLAFDIGPFGLTVFAGIAAMAAIGVANGVAFWRYSNTLGGRRALAGFVLFVAVGLAALGAVLVHLLFQAFKATR